MAYGSSIIVMMATPFALLGLIGISVYVSVKRAQAKLDAAEQ